MTCCICGDLVAVDDPPTMRAWTDPGGEQCVAHLACLLRLGEFELFGQGRRWT